MDRFDFVPVSPAFVEALHTDVDKVFTHDYPKPNFTLVMNKVGSPWFTDKYEMMVPSTLHSVLQNDKPPTWEYFKSTPSAIKMKKKKLLKDWYATYVLMMEHAVDKSQRRLSIGSGSAKGGAHDRIRDYLSNHHLPEKVEVFMERDYEIVHIGILVLIKKPEVKDQAMGRLWTLVNEARFTWRFWSVYQKQRVSKKGHSYAYAEQLCTWDIDELEWQGLDTHTPLRDLVEFLPHSDEDTELFEKVLLEKAEKVRLRKLAYTKTEKGRATRKVSRVKYDTSEKCKATNALYRKSDDRKAAVAKYDATEKARATRRRRTINQNIRRKEARRAAAAAKATKKAKDKENARIRKEKNSLADEQAAADSA